MAYLQEHNLIISKYKLIYNEILSLQCFFFKYLKQNSDI